MSQPLITVVVPVYNRAGIVERTLDSLAEQTLRPLRLVLVDNGSTDATPEVLGRWADSRRAPGLEIEIGSELRRGAAAARARGLSMVRTPYVMFFDSDDLMLSHHCADFAAYLSAHPDIDIAGRDIRHRFLSGREVTHRYGTTLRSHVFHASLATARYVVRTEFIRSAGGWNPDTHEWDDYELGMRLLAARPRMGRVGGRPGALSLQLAESITGVDFSSRAGAWERTLDMCEATLRRHGLNRAVQWIELRRAILAGHYLREGHSQLARSLMAEISARQPRSLNRLAYRMACGWVGRGLRGSAVFSYLLR